MYRKFIFLFFIIFNQFLTSQNGFNNSTISACSKHDATCSVNNNVCELDESPVIHLACRRKDRVSKIIHQMRFARIGFIHSLKIFFDDKSFAGQSGFDYVQQQSDNYLRTLQEFSDCLKSKRVRNDVAGSRPFNSAGNIASIKESIQGSDGLFIPYEGLAFTVCVWLFDAIMRNNGFPLRNSPKHDMILFIGSFVPAYLQAFIDGMNYVKQSEFFKSRFSSVANNIKSIVAKEKDINDLLANS